MQHGQVLPTTKSRCPASLLPTRPLLFWLSCLAVDYPASSLSPHQLLLKLLLMWLALITLPLTLLPMMLTV